MLSALLLFISYSSAQNTKIVLEIVSEVFSENTNWTVSYSEEFDKDVFEQQYIDDVLIRKSSEYEDNHYSSFRFTLQSAFNLRNSILNDIGKLQLINEYENQNGEPYGFKYNKDVSEKEIEAITNLKETPGVFFKEVIELSNLYPSVSHVFNHSYFAKMDNGFKYFLTEVLNHDGKVRNFDLAETFARGEFWESLSSEDTFDFSYVNSTDIYDFNDWGDLMQSSVVIMKKWIQKKFGRFVSEVESFLISATEDSYRYQAYMFHLYFMSMLNIVKFYVDHDMETDSDYQIKRTPIVNVVIDLYNGKNIDDWKEYIEEEETELFISAWNFYIDNFAESKNSHDDTFFSVLSVKKQYEINQKIIATRYRTKYRAYSVLDLDEDTLKEYYAVVRSGF